MTRTVFPNRLVLFPVLLNGALRRWADKIGAKPIGFDPTADSDAGASGAGMLQEQGLADRGNVLACRFLSGKRSGREEVVSHASRKGRPRGDLLHEE